MYTTVSNQEIYTAIRAYCKAKKITVKEFAKISGVDRGSIYKYGNDLNVRMKKIKYDQMMHNVPDLFNPTTRAYPSKNPIMIEVSSSAHDDGTPTNDSILKAVSPQPKEVLKITEMLKQVQFWMAQGELELAKKHWNLISDEARIYGM